LVDGSLSSQSSKNAELENVRFALNSIFSNSSLERWFFDRQFISNTPNLKGDIFLVKKSPPNSNLGVGVPCP
jgi:hypothetical protein